MTTNQKSPGESTPAANREPISIQVEIVDGYEEVVAEPIAVTPMAAEEVAAELGEIKAGAVSIAATLGELPSWPSPEANKLYKLILDLTDGVNWPLRLQAAWLSSPA
jgi:hypothetical protein